MSSRSHYDYSLWPEHARPRRRRFSLKAIAATLTVLTVCAFAGSVVYSEFTQVPNSRALVGRTWPLQPVVDQPVQVTPPPVQAAAAPVTEPDAEATQAKPAPRMPVNAANRKVLPTIGTARAQSAETDGRGTSSPRPSTEASVPTPPAAVAITPETTASTDTPAELKPVAVEKPAKPRRKVTHRRQQERSNTPVVATQVYDYPDGRRVTVYRRLNTPEGYNGYASTGYPTPGTWRPAYAERSGAYRPY